jgi:hypothetical protein
VHDPPNAGRCRGLAHVHRAIDVRAHVFGPGLVAQRQERGVRDHGVGAAEARFEAIAFGEIDAAQLDPALARSARSGCEPRRSRALPRRAEVDEIAAEEAGGSRHRDRRACSWAPLRIPSIAPPADPARRGRYPELRPGSGAMRPLLIVKSGRSPELPARGDYED